MNAIKAILLDIEGTTTPITFVHEVLFPFAEERVEDFIQDNYYESDDLKRDLERLMWEYENDDSSTMVPCDHVAYLKFLIKNDRKSTALKSIQGKIWKEGYESGELKGAVYDDVVPALQRWKDLGKSIGIFSSGSVLAQKLLFGFSDKGDLNDFFSGNWDTTTGPKKESKSYQKIAEDWGFDPSEILFISDAEAELEAAKNAGCQTLHSKRPNIDPLENNTHHSVTSFNEVK